MRNNYGFQFKLKLQMHRCINLDDFWQEYSLRQLKTKTEQDFVISHTVWNLE